MIIMYYISCCKHAFIYSKTVYKIYYENIRERFKIILCCYKVNRKTGVQVSRDKKTNGPICFGRPIRKCNRTIHNTYCNIL